jgi:GTP-binding protein EngB required for normal cell division
VGLSNFSEDAEPIPSAHADALVSLGALIAVAESAAQAPTDAQRRAITHLRDLQARLSEGALRVAVLGQFKRGKSSLLNAILGQQLLPMGVTPVTAIATIVKGAERPRLRVSYQTSHEPEVCRDPSRFADILALYVSEEANPNNKARVASVEIDMPLEPALAHIAFVDTPGVGSTLKHNTETAERAIAECDAGMFVLSPEPPITAVEIDYLRFIRRHLPKLLFVLNKVDQLDGRERAAAEAFIRKALNEALPDLAPVRIFALSARRALTARESGDAAGLAASGLPTLKQTLVHELAREKGAILLATTRARAQALFAELLFHAEFKLQSLLTPRQELERKIAEFEQGVARLRIEAERHADSLAVDRRRLIAEINQQTEALWRESRSKFRALVADAAMAQLDTSGLRDRIAQEMATYFEEAFKSLTEDARKQLLDRLAERQGNVAALIGKVREAAASLMSITAAPPPPEEALALSREPYWVPPTPALSISDATALAVIRLLPKALRRAQLRKRLFAETERAALRNVANLDWALRQNIEEGLRRFETASAEQLAKAIDETVGAMREAIRVRATRDSEIENQLGGARASVATLKGLVRAAASIETP